MFTFDAGGGVGKRIMATSLETGMPAGGRRLSLAAIQAAVPLSAAPVTPLVEKTVVVPVYPTPQQSSVAPGSAAAAAGGSNAVSSEVTAVTSPIAEGQNPPTATQRKSELSLGSAVPSPRATVTMPSITSSSRSFPN